MDALSLATNGIIVPIGETPDITVTRIYYPLTIDINNQKPTITIRPIRKQIHLEIKE